VKPADAWMVGDTYRDVDAGHAAGCARSILIRYPGRVARFAEGPSRVIESIMNLVDSRT
jgi:phosphoglycolate phosphatase-like HAD superfamily hydrolase